MRLMLSVSDVSETIHRAKSAGTSYCTNFFAAERRLRDWIDHGQLYCEDGPGYAFFLRRDLHLTHLYFCGADEDTLRASLHSAETLAETPTVVDVIGNEDDVERFAVFFENVGWRQYSNLIRMSRPSGPLPLPVGEVNGVIEFATSSDAPVVFEMIERTFDRNCEQIPHFREIERAISERQILVARVAGEVAGILFFETQKLTSVVRYWYVLPKYREMSFGAGLMRTYISMHSQVRRFVLWVVASNVSAKRKYEHYGFRCDGLVDRVLANEKVVGMQSIVEVLQSIRPEFDYSSSQDFITDGMLDSFDVVALVASLDKRFGIQIAGTDIVPENFRNLLTIQLLLRKCGVQI